MRIAGDNSEYCKLGIKAMEYHGWLDSYLVTNGVVEAVIVPSIGRVMQFRLAGDTAGVFWENRSLDGMLAAEPTEWANFGGDKAWPSRQQDWQAQTGRAWPPPLTFDGASTHLTLREYELILTSPLDPHYGVQVMRHISMRPDLPEMEITTRFLKVNGSATKIGVWTVTQLKEPERVFALLPEPSTGYEQVVGPTPKELWTAGRLLSLRRETGHNIKIATAGNTLAWMDEFYVLRIDGQISSGSACKISVYTNKDPHAYVELETEGPVTSVACGDCLELTNTYTLSFRSEKGEIAEAEKIFGLAARAELQ